MLLYQSRNIANCVLSTVVMSKLTAQKIVECMIAMAIYWSHFIPSGMVRITAQRKKKKTSKQYDKHSFAAISSKLAKLEKAFNHSTARSGNSKRRRSHHLSDRYSDASDLSYNSDSK